MTKSQQTRYVNQQKLGAGAMGEVWLANDTLLNRPVALKYLRATDGASDEASILAEARMLASLNHPNITAIYDAIFDEQEERFCLVMEFVEGTPLSDLIDNWSGPIPLDLTLEVAIGVLQALQYAHGKGIVHRDIKPGNVMMAQDGVKLTDFGVAGLISMLAQGSQYVAGTPAYMSPEQIMGEPTDGRADLYGVGVMLFEMASGGHAPFKFGEDMTAVFDAHLEQTPRPLRNYALDAPLALERAILRLMAKNPADRFQDAGAAIDALRSIQTRLKFSQSYLDLLDPEANPLVGRDDELDQLQSRWRAVQETAKPHLMVIQGETGIGKSRLITDFLGNQVVDREGIALAGRCDESGAPYAPYADILATIVDKHLTRAPITPEQTDRLVGQIPDLARLLNIAAPPAPPEPENRRPQTDVSQTGGLWQVLVERVPEHAPAEPAEIEWQFYATILAILNDLGPAAIFLENARFLDEASAALTGFLIRQAQLPIFFLAACRCNEEAIAWLESFATDEYETMNLSPLLEAAASQSIANLLGSPAPAAAVDWITRRSRGNPLQIEQITHHLLDSRQLRQDEAGQWHYQPDQEVETPTDAFLPQAVLGAFTRRVEKLSKSSRQALAVAALLEPGPEFDLEPWLALLGGESQQEQTQAVLNEALSQRLVRKIGDHRYAFRPADVGKALASILTTTQRHQLHRRIAELLQQQQADPLLVGHHFEQAGAGSEAARHLEKAGRQAMATNAVDTAIVYYDRAGQLAETPTAHKALGALYRLKDNPAASIRAFEKALALVESASEKAGEAQIRNGLCLTLWLYDHYEAARHHAAAVLELTSVPEREQITAQSHLSMISWLTGQLAEAEVWGQKSLAAWQQQGNEAAVAKAHNRLGQVYLSQGQLARAETSHQRALEIFQRLEDGWSQARSLNNLGRVAMEQGELKQAESFLDLAQQVFDKMHSREGLMAVYANRGRALLYQHRPDEALPWLTKALPLRGKRNVYLLSDIYLLIARVSLAQVKIDRAQAAATDALQLVEPVGNQEFVALAQATLAQIYAAQGSPSTADDLFKKALGLFDQMGSRIGLVRTQLQYAQFLAQQGQSAAAAKLEKEARGEATEMELYLP